MLRKVWLVCLLLGIAGCEYPVVAIPDNTTITYNSHDDTKKIYINTTAEEFLQLCGKPDSTSCEYYRDNKRILTGR